jgi:hypothetical protein
MRRQRNSVKNQESFSCPLLKKEIDMGACYEVQAVITRQMTMDGSILKFNREEAERVCDGCPYNQLA